jgi:hypothetical protein
VGRSRTYIFFRLILVIMVFAKVVILLIIVILEIVFFQIIIHLLELESLSSEPVYGTRDKLLLNVFSKLVVQLETFLNVRCSIVIVLICGCLWRREEVEKRLRRDGLLDNAGLLCVYGSVSFAVIVDI